MMWIILLTMHVDAIDDAIDLIHHRCDTDGLDDKIKMGR